MHEEVGSETGVGEFYEAAVRPEVGLAANANPSAGGISLGRGAQHGMHKVYKK